MKRLSVLLVVSFLTLSSSLSLAQKKGEAKHTNLTEAFNALAHARSALMGVRYDDEKGSRAEALNQVNNALKEATECFKVVGETAPSVNVAVARGDESGN